MMLIVNILTCLFVAIITSMFINSYYKQERSTSMILPILSVALLAVTIYIVNAVAKSAIMNIVLLCLAIFGTSFFYGTNVKINTMLTVIATLVFSLTEIITFFTITLVTGISTEEAAYNEAYRILGIILSKMLAFIALKIISAKHVSGENVIVKSSYWLLFFFIFVVSILATCLLFIFQSDSELPLVYNDLTVVCSFGLLYSTFFTLYLYERIAKQTEFEAKQEFFQQQIRAQSKHLNDILIAQKQVKKMRHDLANHNISLQTYFENHDWEAGLDYVKKMSPKAVFKEDIIETGNSAFDAIINTKRSIALSKNISFDAKLQIPENIFVDAVDICIIFGNALDNSIEACEQVKEGKTAIFISVVYEDNSLICKIVNSAAKSNIKFLHTTKSDKQNHGLGIENIRSALSKYKNVCRFKQIENEFVLSFVIFEN